VDANPVPISVPLSRKQRRDMFIVGEFDGERDDAVVVRPFESFDLFVSTHGKALVRCAYLIVGDANTAQDVVQIALVKVARRWGTVVDKGHPLPYVRSAVVHSAISWRRRKWHGEVPNGALPDHAEADPMSAVDNRDRLRRALAELPRRQRAAVVLRHYLDLDEVSTAAALGCSVGTVKSQTAKGLARLRASMD
jgi:RNA polymerase sigma-70 factor (sigma-E family)